MNTLAKILEEHGATTRAQKMQKTAEWLMKMSKDLGELIDDNFQDDGGSEEVLRERGDLAIGLMCGAALFCADVSTTLKARGES